MLFLSNIVGVTQAKTIKIHFYDVLVTHQIPSGAFMSDTKAPDGMMALFKRLKQKDPSLLAKFFIGIADVPRLFQRLTAHVSEAASSPLTPSEAPVRPVKFSARPGPDDGNDRPGEEFIVPDEKFVDSHVLRQFMSDQSFFWDNIQPSPFMVDVVRVIKETRSHTILLTIICTDDWQNKRYEAFKRNNGHILALFDAIVLGNYSSLNCHVAPGGLEAQEDFDVTLRPGSYGDGLVVEQSVRCLDMLVRERLIHKEQASTLRDKYFEGQALAHERPVGSGNLSNIQHVPDAVHPAPTAVPGSPGFSGIAHGAPAPTGQGDDGCCVIL